MCRFTSVTGNSSHRLVIRVLPSRKKEKPDLFCFRFSPSLPPSFLSLLHLFASRARTHAREHSCNSGKLMEAQRCLAEPGPARLYLPRHKYPAKMPAGVERVRNGGGGDGAAEMMKAKRDAEGGERLGEERVKPG